MKLIYRAVQQNKTVWVGSTHNLESRKEGLRVYLGRFSLEVLEEVQDENRYIREQFWMDYFLAHGEPLQNKIRAVVKLPVPAVKQPTLRLPNKVKGRHNSFNRFSPTTKPKRILHKSALKQFTEFVSTFD